MSVNHQFIQHEEKIVKRYTKTVPHMVTGKRLDPNRPENQLTWLLQSPDKNFSLHWSETEAPKLTRIAFTYGDEVIELYSDVEVRLFERLNSTLIEQGVLKIYDQSAPLVDTTNLLTDAEVTAIAATKQLPALKKRIATITSIHTLRRILEAIETLDRPMSVARTLQNRIKELETT